MPQFCSPFLLSLLLLGSLNGFSQPGTADIPNTYESIEAWLNAGNHSNGSIITFDESVHDFNTLLKGAPCAWTFTFTNTGTDPLYIHQVKTSSGSVVASWERTKVYAPGEKGWVKIKQHSGAVGNFQKTTMVFTNSSAHPKVGLRIMGKIIPVLSDDLSPKVGPVNK